MLGINTTKRFFADCRSAGLWQASRNVTGIVLTMTLKRFLPPRLFWKWMGRIAPYQAISTGASAKEFDLSARELVDQICEQVTIAPDARILEIGCGLGRLLAAFSDRVAEAHGVDISTAMVEKGRKKYSNKKNIQFFLTSGDELSALEDNHYDFVFSYAVFQHIPRSICKKYIESVRRVLKPDGLFLLHLLYAPDLQTCKEPAENDPFTVRLYDQPKIESFLFGNSGFSLSYLEDLQSLKTGDSIFVRAIPVSEENA